MTTNKRLLSGVIAAFCGGLFFLVFLLGGSGEATTTTTTTTTTTLPAGECTSQVHYFRHDLPAELNHFGPAAPDGDVAQVLADLHNRICVDPGLTTAIRQHSERQYTSPEERLAITEGLVANREAWALNVLAIEARQATAVKVEIVDMTERYQTLYMIDTPVPEIYQDVVDRPEYRVLRFTYPDGSADNYKLDCGYQPVEPVFAGIPGPPPTAPPGKGGKVTPSGPNPPPPPGPPPTTAPPTTAPPTTCPPTVCKGSDTAPAACIDNVGVSCSGIPGSGGSPGNGGAINHGSDGYSPSDPPPPTWVELAPVPPYIVTLPPTTAPPPPSQNLNPGEIPA